MNQLESRAKNRFKDKSQGRIHIEWIENLISSGTADANCINRRGTEFWIEFKAMEGWPKRPSTIALKGAFKKGQIPFLKQRISWNGKAFVLLEVDYVFYLLNPKGEIELETATTQEIKSNAIKIGLDSIIEYLESL